MPPMSVESRNKLHELYALLEEERELILAGRFSDLTKTAMCKEKLVQEVASKNPNDDAILHRISKRLERNRALLTSVVDGLRAASSRLGMLRQTRDSLGFYDREGRKENRTIQSAKALERRA